MPISTAVQSAVAYLPTLFATSAMDAEVANNINFLVAGKYDITIFQYGVFFVNFLLAWPQTWTGTSWTTAYTNNNNLFWWWVPSFLVDPITYLVIKPLFWYEINPFDVLGDVLMVYLVNEITYENFDKSNPFILVTFLVIPIITYASSISYSSYVILSQMYSALTANWLHNGFVISGAILAFFLTFAWDFLPPLIGIDNYFIE